jgi:hypothetical protein
LGPAGDFAVEIGSELSYFASRFTGRAPPEPTGRDIGQVFGVEGYSSEKGEAGGAYAFCLTRAIMTIFGLRPDTGIPSAASPEYEEKQGALPQTV